MCPPKVACDRVKLFDLMQNKRWGRSDLTESFNNGIYNDSVDLFPEHDDLAEEEFQENIFSKKK